MQSFVPDGFENGDKTDANGDRLYIESVSQNKSNPSGHLCG